MKKKNPTILYVGNDLDYFCKHHRSIADYSVRRGFEIVTALPSKQKRIGTYKNYPFTFSAASQNPFNAIRSIIELLNIYTTVKPEIVHHFTLKISLLGGIAARLARVKSVVHTISGLGYFINRSEQKNIFDYLVVRGLKFAFGGKNTIGIFFNIDDRQYCLQRNIVRLKDSQLINGTGVDMRIYQATPLPHGRPIVLLPARLVYAKGIAEFVQAAQIINQDKINARFVLVGKIIKNHPVAIPEKIIRRWEKNNIIEYWGDKNTMQSVYKKTNIVCLPSYYEGLPTVLVEAGASCRPIVATDIPGNRAVVDNGVNGILAPVKNATMLASAIQRLLNDIKLQKNMGINGRKLVEEKFDSVKIAKIYIGLYEQLIGNR